MGAAGVDIAEHLKKKYNAPIEQSARSRAAIGARGEELGFRFEIGKRDRVYKTLDAHRLLHWAQPEGRKLALKHALFAAYCTAGPIPSDHDVLGEIAAELGLDAARAR
jgi:predicted DsbA family dithiol-disulfide isomerase